MTAAVPPLPRATVRVQFHRDFGFDAATAVVPYFAALGISHLYASPFLLARPGSTHGYDIIDHNRLNPEIGDFEALDRLVATLAAHGMGLILDFVPNHMGIFGADNPWWLDVLEWGQASPFAKFFDIDWQSAEPSLKGKVLVPVLGAPYGTVLDRGDLVLRLDPDRGSFSLHYFDHRLPVAVKDYPGILRTARLRLRGSPATADTLSRIAKAFSSLRPADGPIRQQAVMRQHADDLKRRLATLLVEDPTVGTAVAQTVEALNGTPGRPETMRALHALLERQFYRVAYWRVATAEINYRRFFDINDLAGLRMEETELFELSHQLVFRLIAEGKIAGLRLDHIDGLYDPADYCRRLQDRAAYLLLQAGAGAAAPGPPGAATPPVGGIARDHVFYLLVEKILAGHERLREDWPVDGTTGYDFMGLVNGLFVDPAAEPAFTELYDGLTGRRTNFDEVVVASKRQILETSLASELLVLANEAFAIARQSWRTRDFTRSGLARALADIVVHFPVYRTYITGAGVSEADRRDLDWAVGRGRKGAGTLETLAHDFLRSILGTDLARNGGSEFVAGDIVHMAMKFQQFTAPVMAKAVEDTAYYRYTRLLSLNEVGGEPARFGVTPAVFHRANQERRRRWPYTLLATATHDHKRGEDVRARIDVLTEIPEEWARQVQRWTQLNRSKKRQLDQTVAPDANDEYLLYQTLVGAWPPTVAGPEDLPGSDFPDRIAACLLKSVREAKWHTSWTEPNPSYEDGTVAFARALLDPTLSHGFLQEFQMFQARIAVAGAMNGLVQTVLRLTVPGVPDLYQGCELWDLSLVDPDNRRPVDFAARADALAASETVPPATLLAQWRDGRIKQAVIARILGLRRRLPLLFAEGDYRPLETAGPCADRVVAFERRLGDQSLVVVVPRLVAGLLADQSLPLVPSERWGTTAVTVGAAVGGRDLFTGAPGPGGDVWPVGAALAAMPVAVVVAGDTP